MVVERYGHHIAKNTAYVMEYQGQGWMEAPEELAGRMVLWNAFNTVISWQLRDCDIAPIFTPLFHAGGLSVFLPPIVAIGGTIILHRGFDAEEICRTLEQEQFTVIFWKACRVTPPGK